MKILRLFTIILILMNSTMLLGQGAGYQMELKEVKALAGETVEVELEITNEGEFVAFGLDIPLPEGFEFAEGSFQLSERSVGHSYSATVIEGDILRIFVFHQEEPKAFLGWEGVMATFDLVTPEAPGTYTLDIVDGVLSDADAEEILPLNTVPGQVQLVGNEITILDTEVNINQDVTIDIEIDNYQEFTAFEVQVPLPEGFTFVEGSGVLNDERAVDHELDISVDDDNMLKIFSYSMDNTLFLGNGGNIVSFDLTAAPAEGGEYHLIMEEAIVSDVEGENILSDQHDGVVTVFDHNILYVKDVHARTNEIVTLHVVIDNSVPFTAFEADITLPEELEYIENSFAMNQERMDGHEFDFTFEDGVMQIVSYHLDNENYLDFDGHVASFDVQLPAEGGVFEVLVENAAIVDNEANDIITESRNGFVTVEFIVELALADAVACEGSPVVIDMELTNSTDITAFETEVVIPEGFSYVEGSAAFNDARATADHEMDVTVDNGIISFVVYSLSNALFEGTEGAVLDFALEVPEMDYGRTAYVGLQESMAITPDAVDVLTAERGGEITYRPEPSALFAFNGEMASTGSHFEYCYDELVEVTLEEILTGEGPLMLTYVLNDDDPVTIEDIEEGDVLFGPDELPAGEHTLTLTSLVDANGCGVANVEEIYHVTITVNPEPAVLFAFNGMIVETGSHLEFGTDEEVTVTLEEIIAGHGPIEFTYVLNEDDPVTVEDVAEGDVLFEDVLPEGMHTLQLTSLIDANGCAVTNPEEVYYLTIEVVELFEVVFNVDIGPAIEFLDLEGFDADDHHIFISGDFFGEWPVPGEDGTLMQVTEDADIYQITYRLEAGTYEYNYYSDLLGDGFDGIEDYTVRTVEITEDTEIHNIFGYGDDETSVIPADEIALRFYPNPASSRLHIDSDVEIQEVRMIDMLGQVVYSGQVNNRNFEMDVIEYKTGIYFIQVLTTEGIVTERVQITR